MSYKVKIIIDSEEYQQSTIDTKMPFLPKVGDKLFVPYFDGKEMDKIVVVVAGILHEFDNNGKYLHTEIECES